MEKWSVNNISVWLLLIFRKKTWSRLKKSAIYEGDLEEHWPFSGKKAEWMERNLCRNTFPFEKTHYRTFIYFWLNFHESAIRIFTFVLFSFSSDVNQMFKACVCHFSLFLKEKYISSLFQTKYIEKKFNLQLFFLPIVSWAFTLAWATTRCPPSKNFLFWKITVCVIRREVKRSKPTNQADTKTYIAKGLKTYSNGSKNYLTTHQGFKICLEILKILCKYWYILNKWRIVYKHTFLLQIQKQKFKIQ